MLFGIFSVSLQAQSVPDMVLVEGGTFQMGSKDGDPDEKPVHSVTVSSFYIGKYEVTVADYKLFCKETKKEMPASPDSLWLAEHPDTRKWFIFPGVTWWGWQDRHPMQKISWYDAVEYCNWLSGKHRLEKCYSQNKQGEWICDFSKNGYRLPTEAEWEFAARGGKYSKNYRFSGSNNVHEVAWVDDNTYYKSPQNIATLKANEFGLYDMSGNVWEWCNDYYSGNYYNVSPKVNPRGAGSTIYRVLRGGAWHYRTEYATLTSRDGPKPTDVNFNYGFRLAKTR